jgi:hypothetical protein
LPTGGFFYFPGRFVAILDAVAVEGIAKKADVAPFFGIASIGPAGYGH